MDARLPQLGFADPDHHVLGKLAFGGAEAIIGDVRLGAYSVVLRISWPLYGKIFSSVKNVFSTLSAGMRNSFLARCSLAVSLAIVSCCSVIFLYGVRLRSLRTMVRTFCLEIPSFCDVWAGVLWLPACSSWLRIFEETFSIFSSVLADRGLPLPAFLAMPPV